MVKMIDQRLLPHQFVILDCPTVGDTAEAIRDMAIRGAGAIGAAAGYAMAQAAVAAPDDDVPTSLARAAQLIRGTRPTAHDLFYAIDRILEAAQRAPTPEAVRQAAVQRATELANENARAGQRIGEAGAALLRDGMRLLTHCNAGWLAFVDWGSALAPIYVAHRRGRKLLVYVGETRPRSQGAKLTAWELAQEGVPHVVIADTAAGSLFARGELDAVIVGADRIAATGDTANKIGTYTLAVLAQHHGVPFYVAAPRSTFDLSIPDGSRIPIEQRSDDEVHRVSGLADDGQSRRVRITPAASPARNPAFDVTPAAWITRFITEAGLIEPTANAIAQYVTRATPVAARS